MNLVSEAKQIIIFIDLAPLSVPTMVRVSTYAWTVIYELEEGYSRGNAVAITVEVIQGPPISRSSVNKCEAIAVYEVAEKFKFFRVIRALRLFVHNATLHFN